MSCCDSPASSSSSSISILTLLRGDDQYLALTVLNPDGSPYNLTGCAITFTVRQPDSFFSPIVSGYPIVTTDHTDPAAGVTQIAFAASQTANMNADPYYFDIKLTSEAGLISTLTYGTLLIAPR